ncbi:MAG: DNA mismatch repair protein MutS, partial [Hyphomicrobiales bacterium]
VTPLARDGLDAASAERRLKEFFGVATLDAFGAFTRAEIAAAGAALAYVERTQFGARPPLSAPVRDAGSATMLIDAATRANLELTRTLGGDRQGSLLATIDRTVTPGGARLLAERLAGPLTDPAAIAARHDAVELLVADAGLREDLRTALEKVPDVARALARLSLDRGGPRDLAALGAGLDAARAIAALLVRHGELPVELARAMRALGESDPDLPVRLDATLADELPLNRRDGRFVREGFDPALDELRLLQIDSRKVIAQLQARYATETNCRTLRIKHNSMLGYFVEVPQVAGEEFLRDPWRATFVHRQTMSDAMRFSSVELGELEAKIASAADRALKLELGIFGALCEAVLAQ